MPENAERFTIPEDAGRRVALVAAHFNERAVCPTTLVWFTDWSVWPSGERRHIFDRFRASYGEHRRLIDAPAHVLALEESDELLSLVTLGVLFLWDVYVVTENETFTVHYSHDEWGWLSRSAAAPNYRLQRTVKRHRVRAANAAFHCALAARSKRHRAAAEAGRSATHTV